MTMALRTIDHALDRAALVLARYARPVRDGLIIVGLARAGYYFFVQDIQPWTFVGLDARAYWQVDLAHPYVGSGVGDISTYLYSPAFAQVMAPFSLLPFPVFNGLWIALLVVIAAWLVRPWPWAALILFLPISYEVLVGNVHFLIAAAIVLGFRAPALWAFPILTKVTPGLGVLWFAMRREWRAFTQAAVTTAIVVGVSFVLSPSAWSDWIAFLLASPGRSELLIPRAVVSALLIAFGALTGRRWLVPVGVWFALPVVSVNSWVILLATIRLRATEPSEAPDAGGLDLRGTTPVTMRFGRMVFAARPLLVGLVLLTTWLCTSRSSRPPRTSGPWTFSATWIGGHCAANGTFGSVPDYLYSPLAAALTVPALALPTGVAVVAVARAQGRVAAGRYGHRDPRFERHRTTVLLGITVVGFLPLVYDLQLGERHRPRARRRRRDRLDAGSHGKRNPDWADLRDRTETAARSQCSSGSPWCIAARRRRVGHRRTGHPGWAGDRRTGSVRDLDRDSADTGVPQQGGSGHQPRAHGRCHRSSQRRSHLQPVGALPRRAAPRVLAGPLAPICVGLLLAPYTLIYGAGLLPAALPRPRARRRGPRSPDDHGTIALWIAFQVWVGLVLAVAALLPAKVWPAADVATTSLPSSVAASRGAL